MVYKKVVYIKVNDIFDELSEENKRLNNELMFANNCLKVLEKFKTFLGKILHKFEAIIDSQESQELYELDEEFNSIIKCEKHIKESNNGKEVNENSNQKPVESNDETEFNCFESEAESEEYTPKQMTKTKRNHITVQKRVDFSGSSSKCLTETKIYDKYRDDFDSETQRYVCKEDNCSSAFRNSYQLNRHYKEVHPLGKSYICDHPNCNMAFKTISQLNGHSVVHSSERLFLCSVSGCHFRTEFKSGLNRHSATHSEQHFVCSVSGCHFSANFTSDLDKHLEKIHSFERKSFTHRKALSSQESSPNLNIRPPIMLDTKLSLKLRDHFDSETQRYVCKEVNCSSTFKYASNIYRHYKQLHLLERSYICDHPGCSKAFKTAQNLKIHSAVHSVERPFVCTFIGCHFTTKFNSHLSRHFADIHSLERKALSSQMGRQPLRISEPEEEPNSIPLMQRNTFDENTQRYVCPNPSCDMSFEDEVRLRIHFRQNHSITTTYACPVEGCGYTSKIHSNFNSHSLIHSNVRAFMCDECGKTFKGQYILNKHKLQFHSKELSFKCNVEGCDQRFKTFHYMQKHKKEAHNRIFSRDRVRKCVWPECEYQTRRPEGLRIHNRLHTGEKPYVCEWPACERAFRTSPQLKKHLLVHNVPVQANSTSLV